MFESYVEPPVQDRRGILDMAVTYLPGAMQFASDHGIGWRREIVNKCYSKGINLRFLDPTNKIKGLEIKDELDLTEKYKENEEWDKLTEHVKTFRREDLRCVDLSDFLISCIDTSIHQCGTYDEIFTAEDQHKPILAIIAGGKKKAPDWLFDVIDWREMFESVDECVDYLDRINKGQVELDKRWVLIREHLNSSYAT